MTLTHNSRRTAGRRRARRPATRADRTAAAGRREDPSRTRQSLLTLATFRSWGIHWMTPHEGPSERLPDPAPGCEPPTCSPTAPAPSLSSRTHSKGQGTGGSEDGPGRYARRPPVRPGGVDAAQPASRDRSHHLGLAPGMGVPIYSFLVARGCRRVERLEDSPSGLWRTLGKRVGCKPSGVRIPHPPPPPRKPCDSGVFPSSLRRPQQAPDQVSSPSTPPPAPATMTPCARTSHPSSPSRWHSSSP